MIRYSEKYRPFSIKISRNCARRRAVSMASSVARRRTCTAPHRCDPDSPHEEEQDNTPRVGLTVQQADRAEIRTRDTTIESREMSWPAKSIQLLAFLLGLAYGVTTETLGACVQYACLTYALLTLLCWLLPPVSVHAKRMTRWVEPSADRDRRTHIRLVSIPIVRLLIW
jgi:hypothetical protein